MENGENLLIAGLQSNTVATNYWNERLMAVEGLGVIGKVCGNKIRNVFIVDVRLHRHQFCFIEH